MFESTFDRIKSFLSTHVTGKRVAIGSSIAEGLSDTVSTTTSLLVTDGVKQLRAGDYAAAGSIGGITGLVGGITNLLFNGKVINRNWGLSLPPLDCDSDDEIDPEILIERQVINETVSRLRIPGYLTAKYLYLFSTIFVTWMWIRFTLQGVLGWHDDYKSDESHDEEFHEHEDDAPLSSLSLMYEILVIMWVIGLDFPFMFTNQTKETIEGISEAFGIEPGKAPDQYLNDKANGVLARIGQSDTCSKIVQFTGSLADATEHFVPVLCLIPASAIRSLQKYPVWYPIVMGAGGVGVAAFSIAIFLQSFWFEGRVSFENLMKAAGRQYEERKRFIPLGLAKIFDKMLVAGAFLRFGDTFFAIYLPCREYKVPQYISLPVSTIISLFSGMGAYGSDVMESRIGLRELRIRRTDRLDSESTPLIHRGSAVPAEMPRGYLNEASIGLTRHGVSDDDIDIEAQYRALFPAKIGFWKTREKSKNADDRSQVQYQALVPSELGFL